MINKVHNWFSVHGDIRINKDMTTLEFCELLDKLGLEFLGNIGYSEFSDQNYDDEIEVNKLYAERVSKIESGQSESFEIKDADELFKLIKEDK